jgi:hypothetical protein
MSFANLKKNRSSSLEKLSSQLEKMTSKASYSDPIKEKYWTPTRDAAGNGFAIIRFLPEPDGEDMPFVRVWDHGFKGPGGWYIEKSLSTIGQDDPLGKLNSKLWNSGLESDKEQARKQKRRLKYHANILVIKDSAAPENEGRVMLFAFGKKIFDKLNDLMNPQFEDEKPVNPFDFWEGANFKLKIRDYEGYANYDKSEFEAPSPLFGGDEAKLEEVYKQLHSLKDLIDPKNFKTYAELEATLHKALGITGSTAGRDQSAEDMTEESLDMGKLGAKTKDEPKKSSKPAQAAPAASLDDDDSDLEFFRSLANE